MKIRLSLPLFLLCGVLAHSQTAVYPSAVSTDTNLKIAVNRLSTVLTQAVGPGDSSISVQSTAGWVPNMLATIDSEIVEICGASGSALLVGHSTASCPNAVGRGFEGTVAASHQVGPCSAANQTGCVSRFLTAYDINSLRVEVEAIEGTLGANLANVPAAGPSGANALGSYWVSGIANAPANAVNLGALGLGLLKLAGGGAPAIGTSADIIGLWGGTCNGSTFLAGNGSCIAPVGTGNTTSATLTINTITKANGSNSIVNSQVVDNLSGHNLILAGALSADRTFTSPDANSNPVQGIANPSDTQVVNYIDAAGVQHRIAQTGGSGASLAFQNGGSGLGAPSTFNVIAGTGVTTTFGPILGGILPLTIAADTSLVSTRPQTASGTDVFFAPTSGSGTAYVGCVAGNALAAYTDGMVIHFKPDVISSGTPTVNICALGVVNLTMADGTTGSVAAGEPYDIRYYSAGPAFRISNGTGSGSGGSMVYPGAGVGNSTGSAWGTSYAVGAGASDLVQLNGSAQLPAVSAALLTNFPVLNQNSTGTAGNLSGTPTLPNGTAATTQTANDNSAKLATTAYVDRFGAASPTGFQPTPQAVTSGVTTSVVVPFNATLNSLAAAQPNCSNSSGVWQVPGGATSTPTQMTITFAPSAAFTGSCTAILLSADFVYMGVYSGLPTPASGKPLALVTDASAAGVCSTGGGSAFSVCAWSGSAWLPTSGAGGMVYPAAGIGVSTGSAWGSSLTAPTGAIVGTTDTQVLTNKTIDGATPATMAFLDATSSIQTQLNAKQGSLTLTTTGTSGAATLAGGTLNVPQYAGGGSMTWPAAAGIAVYGGSSAWGASLTAPTGAIVGAGQANTYSTGLQDLSAATMKIPTAAGFVATASSMFGFDSTNKNVHLWSNGGDALTLTIASMPSNGNCAKFSVVGSTMQLVDSGNPTCGGIAAPIWSSLQSPSANTSVSMTAYTTSFAYNAATGSGVDMFELTDTASNTGTGNIFRVSTAASSAAHPVEFDNNGNGVQMSAVGVLSKVGTGSVNADRVNGAAVPASAHVAGTNSSNQVVAATATDTAAIAYAAGGGTAQAQTLTLAPAITALTAGLKVCWMPLAANTAAAPTLAVNGLAAKTITKVPSNAALVANDLLTTAPACAIYDGAQYELQNPQTATAGGTGNAAAPHTVTFSGTPTFTCGSATAGTVDDFVMSTALSTSITSSTLLSCTSGESLHFTFQQAASGGPYTVAMPTGFDACTVNSAAGFYTTCGYWWDGTSGHLTGITTTETPSVIRLSAERAAPATPPASTGVAWPDSTDHDLEYMANNSASLFKMFLAGGDCNPVTGHCTTYNGGTAFGTAAAVNTGTSGATIPLLNGANTWSGTQAFAGATVTGITATTVGLGSVTNDVQTKNSIVPNSFAGIRFGNSGTIDTAATAAQVVAASAGSRSWWCTSPGLGDGLNAIAAATYLQTNCYNMTGATVTLTSIKCFTDNGGTSTCAATNGAGTALLTGAITATSSFASGTQSATTTIASGDFIKITFVADGTSKEFSMVFGGTY